MSNEVPIWPDKLDILGVDTDDIYTRFMSGETLVLLGSELGVTGEYLCASMKKHGYVMEREKWGNKYTPDVMRAMKLDYEAGMSQTAIADKYGAKQTYISRVMKRWGIPSRARGWVKGEKRS